MLAQLIAIKELKIQFLIAEEEVGANNTPHIQGYLRSENRIYYRTLRSKIQCYWEEAKGNEEQNIAYCSKTNSNLFKWGKPATKNAQRMLTRDETVKRLQKDVCNLSWDEFENAHPYEATYQSSIWLRFKYEHTPMDQIWNGDLQIKNVWIFGPPGTGKSSWAWRQSQH